MTRDESPFEMFGLQRKYSLDESELKGRYDRLRERLHPDRHVNSSPTERRMAESMTADINEAYGVLHDPLRRAACLLALHGKDPFREGDGNQMPVDFLERQMELRERLDEIMDANDHSAAAGMAAELDDEIGDTFASVGATLDTEGSDLDEAVLGARKLRYLLNCRAQAQQAAEA